MATNNAAVAVAAPTARPAPVIGARPALRKTVGMESGGSAQLFDELSGAIGSAAVADGGLSARYRTDWTGRFGGFDALVVRPGTSSEVAAVLRICADRGVSVVVQGGNTGLVGASVPAADGAVILSTERLRLIGPLDAEAGAITVGAGVTLAQLGAHLDGTGWRFAVDLGARDAATIGGMVATNAGGMRVFRFGPMRRQVIGLEYALADGSVVSRLGGLAKDNTGYPIADLLCGSEGTLAAVTAVRLALVVEPAARCTALAGFDDLASAVHAARRLRRHCPDLEVIELISAECARLVVAERGVVAPVWLHDRGAAGVGALLLLEAAGAEDPSAALGDALALAGASDRVAVATSEPQREALWQIRDLVSPTLATLGEVLKLDVAVGPTEMLVFIQRVTALVASVRGARLWLFGHVCDGNLHVNVTHGGSDPGRSAEATAGPVREVDVASLEEPVLELVAELGGSISAEHGIGRAKARYLGLARSATEIQLMAAIKAVFDPSGVMNPGVVLESD